MKLEELLDKLSYSTGYALMSIWWQINRVIPIGRGCISLAEFIRRLCSRGNKDKIAIKRVTKGDGNRLIKLESVENLQKAWDIIDAKDGDSLEIEYTVPIHREDNVTLYTFYIPYYYPTPIKFPPYSLEEIHERDKANIFHLGVLHAQQGEFDLTPMVKRWAGPKGNFYHDLTKEDGIHVHAKSVMVAGSKHDLHITNTMAMEFTFTNNQVVYWKLNLNIEPKVDEIKDLEDELEKIQEDLVKDLDKLTQESIKEVLTIVEKEKKIEADDDTQTKAAAEYCAKRVPTPVPWKNIQVPSPSIAEKSFTPISGMLRRRHSSQTESLYDTPKSISNTLSDLQLEDISSSSQDSDSPNTPGSWNRWDDMGQVEVIHHHDDALAQSICFNNFPSPRKKQKTS